MKESSYDGASGQHPDAFKGDYSSFRVATLNPPFFFKFSKDSRSPGVSKGGCVYYPIWLGYATGVLEKTGFNVKLIDAPAESKNLEETLAILKEFNPQLVVLQTVTASFENDSHVAEEIKKALPNVKILGVGDHVSALPEESLKDMKSADWLAIREFDFTARDVALALMKKTKVEDVKGLAVRDKSGAMKLSEPRPELSSEELDWIPFNSETYAKHCDIHNYFYPSVLYPEVTIVSARGCKYRCTFCKWPQTFTGHTFRPRSVQNVVDEMEWIAQNLPEVQDIMFEDDTLTQDPDRTIDLCKEILRRDLKIKWTCNSRADAKLEVLQWLKKANCRLICVGFESADQGILNNIKKGTTVEKIRQFMKDTRKAKMLVHGCFMLGNKGETKETVKKTIEFAKELNPDTAQFFPIMVYPGTEAYDWAKKEGLLMADRWSDWLLPDGNHNSIVSRPGLSAEELVDLCDAARREYYIRPGYIAEKVWQGVTTPSEFPRTIISAKRFFKFLLTPAREGAQKANGNGVREKGGKDSTTPHMHMHGDDYCESCATRM